MLTNEFAAGFPDAGGSGAATSGYLQVMPVEFTREELQALRNKAKSQLDWNAEGIRADLLEDLAETLDLLDALEARDEMDLAELKETITEHSQSAGITVEPRMPYPRPDTWVHVTHQSPRCGPDCPMRFMGEA